MNKNTIIGILIVIVLGAVGYALYNSPARLSDSLSSTSTTTVTPPTGNPPPVTTPPAEPSAPRVSTNSSVAASNSTANVSGSVTPNGSLTSYWFEYGETNALGTRTSSQAIGSGYVSIGTPGFITGLKANTTYYYRLSAQNRITTVNGDTFSFKTNNNPPISRSLPTVQTNGVASISRTTVILNGHVNPNGFQTSYWFEYGTDNNFGSLTGFQSAGSNNILNPVSFSLPNLQPLTKYYFRLNAQNQFGTVNGATLNFTTSGPAAPSAPTVDTTGATKITSTSVTFNGRVNPNGANTSYWFEYGTDSLLGNILGRASATSEVPAGTSNVSVLLKTDNLNSNTQYYYRLVGQNPYGTVRGDIVSFKTKS